MDTCIYFLKRNDQMMTFNSAQELTSFLTDNKNAVTAAAKHKDIKYSKGYDPKNETFSKLKTKHQSNIKLDKSKDGEVEAKLKNYIGVTKLITDPSYTDGNSPLTKAFEEQDFLSIMTESLGSEEKAIAYVAEVMEKGKIAAEMGTAIHAISELYFNNRSATTADLLSLLSKRSDIPASYTLGVKTNIIMFLREIDNKLKELHGDDCEILSEVKLRTEGTSNADVVGKIDLVVVDSQGVAHIYDFKTSDSDYQTQKQIKGHTHMCQLAVYKQLLANNGINVNNARVGIIPIQLLGVNHKLKTFTDINTTPYIDIKNEAMNTSYRRIESRVKEIISDNELPVRITTNNFQTLETFTKDAFNYTVNDKIRKVDLEYFIKNRIKQVSNGTEFYFRDVIKNETRKFDTREEAEKAAEKYVEEENEANLSYSNEIANMYKSVQNMKEGSRYFTNILSSTSRDTKFYEQNFQRYIDKGFILNEELLPYGVLVFTHPEYKIMEVIYISTSDLKEKMGYKFGNKITGNLIFDKDTPSHANILDATTGNVELMRIMALLNDFINDTPGYKINNIKVVNRFTNQGSLQSLDVLQSNFAILIQEMQKQGKGVGIQNNFASNDKMVDNYTRILNQLNMTIADNDRLRYLSKYKESINKVIAAEGKAGVTVQTNQEKIKILADIANDLYPSLINEKVEDFSVAFQDMTDDKALLLFYVSDAIRVIVGNEMIYTNEDLTGRWTRENMSPEQLSIVSAISEVSKQVLTPLRNAVKRELSEELTKVKIYNEEYLRDNNSIDSSLDIHQGCIESDPNQGIHRVKNPYDNSSILKDHERKYLLKFLETINKFRYPETRGDHNSPLAKEYIQSGAWFDIPLIKGNLYEGGLKGIKGNLEHMYNTFKDPSEMLNDKTSQKLKDQLRQLSEYVNPLDIRDRQTLLISKGDSYFSRDLDKISREVIYHYTLQTKYNNVLPIIKASMACVYGVSSMTNAEIDNLKKTMLDKLQTAIYQVNHMNDWESAGYGIMATVSQMVNAVTISFNPVSFVRDLFLGAYNNYGRVYTRFWKDGPDVEDLTKAYAWVGKMGVLSIANQNLMHAFNMRYNLAGRDVQSMIDTIKSERNMLLGQTCKSGSMYWTNQITDYQHRMALFVAYLYQEGIMDAYSYDEKTQSLKYDFKKDKRFEGLDEYIKTGDTTKKKMKGIIKYELLLRAHNERLDITEDQKLKFGDPLVEGVSDKEVDNIRNISNQIHGNMDRDTAAQIGRYFDGKFFLRMKNHIPNKLVNMFKKPGKYQMTERGQAIDKATGLPLWVKRTKNAQTGQWEMGYTVNKEESNGEALLQFNPVHEAGAWYAIMDIIHYVKDPDNRQIHKEALLGDEAKMSAFKFMAGDLFFFLFSLLLQQSIDFDKMREDNPLTSDMARAILRDVPRDNNTPSAIMDLLDVLDPVDLSISSRIFDNATKIITNDNYTFGNFLYSSTGFGKIVGMAQ